MESGKRQAAVTTDINVTHGLKGTALTEVGYTRGRSKSSATPFIGFDSDCRTRAGDNSRGGIVWKAFSKSVGALSA